MIMRNRETLSGIFKTVSAVVLLTLVGKAVGFLRDIVLSYYFGATGVTDAFLVSQTIPGAIFQFVGTGLATCYIPVYYKIREKEGIEQTVRFTNQILSLILLFSTVIIFFVLNRTEFTVRLFAKGFTGASLESAICFTKYSILGLYISAFLYVFTSFLQANSVFKPNAVSVVINSIILILSIILAAKVNILFLCWGSLAAIISQLLILLPYVHKKNYRFFLSFDWKNEYVTDFFKLLLPIIIGVSLTEINTLVDKSMASRISIGSISSMSYAHSIIMCVQGGLVQPISTICYSKLAESVSTGDCNSVNNVLKKELYLVFIFLFPICAMIMIFSAPIVSIVFERGAFTFSATEMTSTALLFYAIGMPFASAREFISKFYYANQNTGKPTMNASIGMLINIVLNIVLSRFMGIAGLALATSISSFISCLFLYIGLKQYIPDFKHFLNVKCISYIVLFVVLISITASILYRFLFFSLLIKTLLSMFMAFVLYCILLYLFQILQKIKS